MWANSPQSLAQQVFTTSARDCQLSDAAITCELFDNAVSTCLHISWILRVSPIRFSCEGLLIARSQVITSVSPSPLAKGSGSGNYRHCCFSDGRGNPGSRRVSSRMTLDWTLSRRKLPEVLRRTLRLCRHSKTLRPTLRPAGALPEPPTRSIRASTPGNVHQRSAHVRQRRENVHHRGVRVHQHCQHTR